ncbi:MAG: phytoene desaturase family protein [Actinomycetales bacterium]
MPPAAVQVADAVVIGAGPNGLVAANALVDAGWDVVVLEAQPTVGGAVRSAQVTAPGFVSDLFSAFYPLAAASPVIRDLELGRHGLSWSTAPDVLAHALDDGRCALLAAEPDRTAESLDGFASGDGDAWLAMFEQWRQIRDPLLDSLFAPLPPIRGLLRVLRRLGVADGLDLARLAALPVRRLAEEHFAGAGAGLLLTGNAMHADIPPDAAGSGLFGWLLCMLGQDVGFPVPRGGAQELSDALTRRITGGGGVVMTGTEVERVLLAGRTAVGVRTTDGVDVRARRAVLADVVAPVLYRRLIGADRLAPALVRRLEQFQADHPTMKMNWALSDPVPWRSPEAAGAGTVHLGVDDTGFVDFAADLSTGRAPARPFVLFGQMTTADPTRSPAGTESAWAYTHLPAALAADDAVVQAQVGVVEAAIERVAPGFTDRVIARHVQTPTGINSDDANLLLGAVNGGTAALHQQAIFRPFAGLGRPETPYERLYLASASAHPGGGVHGACGWNAARTALRDNGALGSVRRSLQRTAWRRLL